MTNILKYKPPINDYDGPTLEYVLKHEPPKIKRSVVMDAAIDGVRTIFICMGIICYLGFAFAAPFLALGWLKDILMPLLTDVGTLVLLTLLSTSISMCFIIIPWNIASAKGYL